MEELADRWRGKASVYIVYTREAHPRARGIEKFEVMVDQMHAMDADGDGRVSLEESSFGPAMFGAFDLDDDGWIGGPEMLSARWVGDYAYFEDSENYEQRVQAARLLKAESELSVPVLVDGMDNRMSRAFGGWPNQGIIISQDGTITTARTWAHVEPLDAGLRALLGADAAAPLQDRASADWSPLADQFETAQRQGQRVLLHFGADGCPACDRMESTLQAEAVRSRLDEYAVISLKVERDADWQLFDALQLDSTPAFVLLDEDRTATSTLQGFRNAATFLSFLDGSERTPADEGLTYQAQGGREAHRSVSPVNALKRMSMPNLHAQCENGRAEACLAASRRIEGERNEADDLRLVSYERRGCELGLGEACAKLVGSYRRGLAGLAKNSVERVEASARGCKLGFVSLCQPAARAYYYGDIVVQDTKRAQVLLDKGCSLGSKSLCQEPTRAFTSGGFFPARLRAMVTKRQARLRDCAGDLRNSPPDGQHIVVVRFTVNPKGKVSRAKLLSTTLGETGAEVGECVIRRIRRWKFPVESGSTDTTVTYPFRIDIGP